MSVDFVAGSVCGVSLVRRSLMALRTKACGAVRDRTGQGQHLMDTPSQAAGNRLVMLRQTNRLGQVMGLKKIIISDNNNNKNMSL